MLIGLPDLAKVSYRNYQTFNIPYLFFVKKGQFILFYKLINLKLISQFVCALIQYKYDQYNLFTHAQLQTSVNKASTHKKEHNSDIKRDKLVEFRRIVC